MKNNYFSSLFVKGILVFFAGIFLFINSGTAQPLSGTYTIGPAAADYLNIQLAIDDMKLKGISGPVLFNIQTGAYNAAYVMPAITGASPTATITFQAESGNARDVVLQQAGSTNPAFQFDGAKHVILQNLLFIGRMDIGVSNSEVIKLVNSSANNTITRCIIQCAAISTGISIGEYNVPGHYASNTTISHNMISGGTKGIFIQGGLANPDTGNVITSNQLIDFLYNAIELRYVERLVISNNFISSKATLTGNLNLYGGIAVLHGYHLSILHNTIYLYGLDTSVVKPSYPACCLYIHYGSDNTIINNILVNKVAYGVAFGYSGMYKTYEAHHNILYSEGTLLAMIDEKEYYDVQAISDFCGMERYSAELLPVFVSDTDLHIQPVSVPFIDGLGDPVLATDIDKEQRNDRYPDIGADEVVDLAIDLGISSVNPGFLNDSTFEVRTTLINDGKNSLNGSSVQLAYSTDGGNTWSPSESLVISGLVNTYETLDYTFSTLLPKKQVQSNTFCVRVVPGSLPADPNPKNNQQCQEFCAGSISGNFTVGAGADFPTIQKAIVFLSLFCELNGPVTISIGPGIYEEQLVIPSFKGASEVNTVTFKSSNGDPSQVLIRHNAANTLDDHATIRLVESRFVRLDGLGIDNRSMQYASGVQLTAGAAHNSMENCHIQLDSSAQTNSFRAGIIFAEDTNGSLTPFTGTDYNTFTGNQVSGGDFGFFLKGKSTAHNKSNQVLSNRVSSVWQCGIHGEGQDSLRVLHNQVQLIKSSTIGRGMEIIKADLHTEIAYNYLADAAYAGLVLDNVKATDTALVYNNVIAGGFHGEIPGAGILLNEVRKTGLYYNSVFYDDSPESGSALRIAGGAGVQLLNNIFYNAGQGYAAYFTDTFSVSSSDHNDYYTLGTNFAWWKGNRSGLESLQGASGKDLSSVSVNPSYNSAYDLHTMKAGLDGAGVPVNDITHDYENNLRHPSTPDIGAYEFVLGQDAAVTKIITPSASVIMPGSPVTVSVEVSNLGTASLGNIPLRLLLNGLTQLSDTLWQTLSAGQKTVHTFDVLTISDTGLFELCAETRLAGDIAVFNDQYCRQIHVTDTTQTGMERPLPKAFRIYPNPASTEVFIDCTNEQGETFRIELYNALGQCLMIAEESCEEGHIRVAVHPWPEGIYLLKVSSARSAGIVRLHIRK